MPRMDETGPAVVVDEPARRRLRVLEQARERGEHAGHRRAFAAAAQRLADEGG